MNGATTAAVHELARMKTIGIFLSRTRHHRTNEESMKSQRVARLALLVTVLILVTSHAKGEASVDEYNVPGEIERCVKSSPGVVISGEINPFYLSGDFDGDGKLDFAVQVSHSKLKGVLICLSSRKLPLLVGAGSSLIWGSAAEWGFDAWSVVPKESTAVSRPPKARHDAILLDIKEAASGLLYWDGSTLRWEQLTD